MNKRLIAAFDFDGTLIEGDTLLLFIQYARGRWRFYKTFALYSPLLILMKLGLYSNDKLKERIFRSLFAGMPYTEFVALGKCFATEIERYKLPDRIERLNEHLRMGATVYVISASIYEWVQPWCALQGVHDVLATRVAVDHRGRLTGYFASPNCYGEEKVRRLLSVEPQRAEYYLYAYGDSAGDHALLAFADEGHLF